MGKKVLLVRLSSLGDCIFNIPLANTLKRNGYDVTWLVSEKGYDIIKDNPCVDNVILAPFKKWKQKGFCLENFKEYLSIIKQLRQEKFDIAIDAQMLFKSMYFMAFCGAKRRIIANNTRELSILGGNEIIKSISDDKTSHAIRNYLKYAEYLKLDTTEVIATLPPSDKEAVEKIDNILNNLDKSKPIVTIAPATTWVPKHWDKDLWKELIEKIENKYNLIFTGTSSDTDLISHIGGDRHLNLAGKTNLKELIELFRRTDLLLSLDSGSTHLAWATQIPKIVMILCCTPPAFYTPIGSKDKYRAVSGNLECQHCHKRKCPLSGKEQNACTKVPTVDEVLKNINELMG